MYRIQKSEQTNSEQTQCISCKVWGWFKSFLQVEKELPEYLGCMLIIGNIVC